MKRAAFCGIPTKSLVYASPQTREEFDLLDLPETVFEWQPDATQAVIQSDGRAWESRCHAKTLGDLGRSQVSVIFQWFEYRPVAATGVEA